VNERDALLRAILTDPADDTPRLVLADWLEENGEEQRGHDIRLEVAAPDYRLWGGCPEYQDGSWGECTGVTRCRGFVEGWSCWAEQFDNANLVRQMFETHPIVSVRLANREAHLWDETRYPRMWERAMEDVRGFEGGAARYLCGPRARVSGELFDRMVAVCARHHIGMSGGFYFVVGKHTSWQFVDMPSANDAISAACVSRGRELAGLPPLLSFPLAPA
jgi:uncharacterized protein (TIGR02996 family)